MIQINDFLQLPAALQAEQDAQPWHITQRLVQVLQAIIPALGDDYHISEGIAIHNTATVETGVVLKAPVIISANCFIGAHAYLRGGVYLGNAVTIGAGCELKTSIIGDNSAIAHFNFIGDSIIGSHVNFEAGAVAANHYNERTNKEIIVQYNATVIHTGVEKFGALVGDHSKIGANAVLSPGTILTVNSIVKRLELVAQFHEN